MERNSYPCATSTQDGDTIPKLGLAGAKWGGWPELAPPEPAQGPLSHPGSLLRGLGKCMTQGTD